MQIAFINTPQKKRLMVSFILYYPLMSIIAGAPIPMPVTLFEISPAQIAILNFTSLLITIMGSIIGIGFYLERRQNLKLDQQNKKMDKIDGKIDEAVIVTGEHIKEVSNDMREMEKRICESVAAKNRAIEQTIQDKVIAAKELEDERIRNLQNRLNRLEGGGREGFATRPRGKYRDIVEEENREVNDEDG